MQDEFNIWSKFVKFMKCKHLFWYNNTAILSHFVCDKNNSSDFNRIYEKGNTVALGAFALHCITKTLSQKIMHIFFWNFTNNVKLMQNRVLPPGYPWLYWSYQKKDPGRGDQCRVRKTAVIGQWTHGRQPAGDSNDSLVRHRTNYWSCSRCPCSTSLPATKGSGTWPTP